MNIVMVTNTFTPHVGGVARSVAAFSDACFPSIPADPEGNTI